MLLRVRSFVGIVLTSGMMAGCVDDLGARFSGRWGPNPAIPAAAVDTVAQNQYLVLSYTRSKACCSENSGLGSRYTRKARGRRHATGRGAGAAISTKLCANPSSD
jgi:hypothetical protein